MTINPFSSRFTRPGAMAYRFDGLGSVQDILERLATHRCGLIVGAHGTGKSTLLHALSARLESQFPGGRWVQLIGQADANAWTRWRRRLENSTVTVAAQKSIFGSGVLVVDGIEQLDGIARRRLQRFAWRHRQYVLATAHRPLSGFHVVHQTYVNAELVRDLTHRLVDGLGISTDQCLRGTDLDRVVDVRQLWSRLYDRHSQFQLTSGS